MRQSSAHFDALQALLSSISSGGTDINPVALEITSGKKATSTVMTTRGSSLEPSTTTRMGASATLGTDCVQTRKG